MRFRISQKTPVVEIDLVAGVTLIFDVLISIMQLWGIGEF